MPVFFKKTPKKGEPLSLSGVAAGLAGMAKALEKMEVHNGKVDWSNGIPRIIVEKAATGTYGGPFPITITPGATYTAGFGAGYLMIQGYGLNEYAATTTDINITIAGWVVAKVTRSDTSTIAFENVATVAVESSFFTFPIAKITDNGSGVFVAEQGKVIYVGAYV